MNSLSFSVSLSLSLSISISLSLSPSMQVSFLSLVDKSKIYPIANLREACEVHGSGRAESPGTEAMVWILALHTPLQHITLGSGRTLRTHTSGEDR